MYDDVQWNSALSAGSAVTRISSYTKNLAIGGGFATIYAVRGPQSKNPGCRFHGRKLPSHVTPSINLGRLALPVGDGKYNLD